jgi:hypothetical protein
MLAGCASATAFRVDRSDVIGPCQTAVPDRDVLFGVALSGGGSRAALFGEAGLEALARLRTADGASVIDKISHLSSVSGGSIAAAYYALKKPGRDVKVLNADGTLSDAYSALAAKTLAEILGQRLYGGARLRDLAAREKGGDSPGLIINTTLYNNGRRLALTSLPAEAFTYDFFADLDRSLREQGRRLDPSAASAGTGCAP